MKIEFDTKEERRYITPIELEAFLNFFNDIKTILKEPLYLDFRRIQLIKRFIGTELMTLQISTHTNSPIYPEKLYCKIEKFLIDHGVRNIFIETLHNLYKVIYKDIVRQDRISEILNGK